MRVLCEVYILNWTLFSRILFFFRPHHHLSTQLKKGEPFSSWNFSQNSRMAVLTLPSHLVT